MSMSVDVGDIASMAFRALVAGSFACFSTACSAGLFYKAWRSHFCTKADRSSVEQRALNEPYNYFTYKLTLLFNSPAFYWIRSLLLRLIFIISSAPASISVNCVTSALSLSLSLLEPQLLLMFERSLPMLSINLNNTLVSCHGSLTVWFPQLRLFGQLRTRCFFSGVQTVSFVGSTWATIVQRLRSSC